MNKRLFSFAVALLGTMTVFTACKDDSEEDLNLGSSDIRGLVINEVCSSGTDWVELYNSSDQEINLAGFRLQDDKGADEEYIFPAETQIAAKSFLVLEKGTHFSFGISSNGDEITLLDTSYKTIDKITVPALEDGQTFARESDGNGSWAVMSAGTKGRSNTSEPDQEETPNQSQTNLLINEVVSAPLDGEFDFIEIYNPTTEEVDISGFILQDDKGKAEQYIIPEGTKIAPKGFICFTQAQAENPDGSFGFGLSSKGDQVTFLDRESRLIDEVKTPAMEDGQSYARTSDGGSDWYICSTPTKGQSNNGSGETQDNTNAVGVYINEVFTNDQDAQLSSWDDTKDFIELYNATNQDIDLTGFSILDDKMDEKDRYTFPSNTIIKSKSFLTLDVKKNNTNGPSFGLGKGGDKVFLYNKDKVLIDELATGEFQDSEIYSTGRKTDGGSEIVVFTEVSKNASNNGKSIKQ